MPLPGSFPMRQMVAILVTLGVLGSGRVLLEEWIHWGLDADWKWIDASRVSLDNSSHQLHERMTGQLEQWRLSSYSWRPDGVLLGLAQRCWHWLKPRLRRRSPRNWRVWRIAARCWCASAPRRRATR